MKIPLNDYRKINRIHALQKRQKSGLPSIIPTRPAPEPKADVVDAKTPHAEVHYMKKSDQAGKKCGNCARFIKPNKCQTVAPPIAAGGICDRYEKKGA